MMTWRTVCQSIALSLSATIALLGGTGCSHGGSGSEAPAATGTVTLALTDTASDDLESFQVDVTNVTLRRANGATVTLLTTPVRVDFATLDELSDVLRVVDVPPATYTAGSLTFDWTTAVARIAGQGSNASIVDSSGNPLTGTSSLDLTFPNGSISVLANRHRILEFDFDLNSSIETDSVGNKVTVSPTLVLRVDRSDPKTLVSGGRLQSVDATNLLFTFTIQRPGGTALGDVTAVANASTVFQVNGQPSQGAVGISSLDALAVGSWVQVLGSTDATLGRLRVTYVEGGTGTIGGGTDIVEGHVTGRSGTGLAPVLTVLGHAIDLEGKAVTLNTSFTVNLASGVTRVVRRGFTTAFATDDVNVGQLVRAFGTLSGTTLDASTSGSVVRLQPTQVFGFANGTPTSNDVSMTLSRIGLRDQALFNFTVNSVVQADPNAFAADITGLSAAGIVTDTALEMRGFFPPVNAPGADFDATSVTNRDTAFSWLRLRWATASSTAITSNSTTAIGFDTTAAAVALLDRGFVGDTSIPGAPAFSVHAPTTGRGFFVIVEDGAVTIYVFFSSFSTALHSRITAGSKLWAFRGIGTYVALTNQFTASIAVAILQ